MNEKLNLVEILKDCPKGTKFYSTIFGEVKFDRIEKGDKYPIILVANCGSRCDVTLDGKHYESFDGDCTLFPSKEQRDWSKFKIPQKEKFDPKTLKPFDKVLVRDYSHNKWTCAIFSYIRETEFSCVCSSAGWRYCIPYNDETKHLVGTTESAPEYYKYWED